MCEWMQHFGNTWWVWPSMGGTGLLIAFSLWYFHMRSDIHASRDLIDTLVRAFVWTIVGIAVFSWTILWVGFPTLGMTAASGITRLVCG